MLSDLFIRKQITELFGKISPDDLRHAWDFQDDNEWYCFANGMNWKCPNGRESATETGSRPDIYNGKYEFPGADICFVSSDINKHINNWNKCFVRHFEPHNDFVENFILYIYTDPYDDEIIGWELNSD